MLHSHCDHVQYRNFTASFRKSDLHRIVNDHWNPITMLSLTRVRHTTTQNRTLPSSRHGVVCVVVCQLWAWCVCICKLWACTHPFVVYIRWALGGCHVLWSPIVELCDCVSCGHVHIHLLWVPVLLVLWARIVELCAYPSVVNFVCIHPFAAMTRNHHYECPPTWHLIIAWRGLVRNVIKVCWIFWAIYCMYGLHFFAMYRETTFKFELAD